MNDNADAAAPLPGPAAWAKSGTAMHYDRAISSDLLRALTPDGALHSLLTWAQEDPAARDIQLRRQPKGPASWISLYLGLTSLLDLYEQGGQFRLTAHATHKAAGGFHPSWNKPQPLATLAEQLPAIHTYLERVVPKVHPMWLNSEGLVHALIANSTNLGISIINREASISFNNQPSKNKLCQAWAQDLRDALLSSDHNQPWWTALQAKRLGTSPDFLAVDDNGRLLVIEAKPAAAAAGITWGPAQVGFYATMYAAWLQQDPKQARTSLHAQLGQRHQLGLNASEPQRQLSDPTVVVPVLILGPGIVSPEAWGRLAAVADALHDDAAPVAPLELWRLTADGTPRPLTLTSLAQANPPDTADDLAHSSYQERARAAAVAWKLSSPTLPATARNDGPYRSNGDLYPFCLPAPDARHNLLPEAAGAIAFFAKRGIQWHQGISGGPTTHLASSQVQCVNALFRMTHDPSLIKNAFDDVLDIQDVTQLDDAFLTFEYNGGGQDYLGEGRGSRPLTRGANSTSTDAAFAFTSSTGTELALIEWKYTEHYLGSKLSADRAGIREKRYRKFFEPDDGPLNPTVVPYEAIFAEPLYQLVRQQLLAREIERAGLYDRVRVLHIAPSANAAYWNSLDRHSHRLGEETVRDLWQRMLRDSHRDRYLSIDSSRFTDESRNLTSAEYRARYSHT